MESEALTKLVIAALEDVKGIDIRTLDVKDKTSITDVMVIASGNSNRQVKALADSVIEHCKKAGLNIYGSEGIETGEWALVDLGDVVVHIMQPTIRDFYNLEKLWGDESPATAKDKNA
ncbi:MAG: ribosome silencing factor [Gammaproteobacteria bacterium]|nr:ribosome silencing factor [Gammaproteobacteria bacterium]